MKEFEAAADKLSYTDAAKSSGAPPPARVLRLPAPALCSRPMPGRLPAGPADAPGLLPG